jgi:putative hydrolase of the HAD superfamily
MAQYDVLLFDAIGVLVEYSKETNKVFLEWTNLSREEAVKKWSVSPAVHHFETGRITRLEFAQKMVDEFSLPVSPPEFLAAFSLWVKGLYEGAEGLLERLSRKYRLACFTNINEVHWPLIRDQFGMGRLFQECFLSHRMGMSKPDPEAFRYVISSLNCHPGRIAFFDDTEANAKSASRLGIHAFVTKGLSQLETKLKELAII